MSVLVIIIIGLVVVLIVWPKGKGHSSNNSSGSMSQTMDKALAKCEDIARQDFGGSPGASIAYDSALSSCQKMYGSN